MIAGLILMTLLGGTPEVPEALARLQARAATLEGPWTPERERDRAKLQEDLLGLLSQNGVKDAAGFRQLALLTPALNDWPTARQRYECLMVATALGDPEAPRHLAQAWDGLLVAMGRRPRLGSLPVPRVAGEGFRPEPTLAPIHRVLTQPEAARRRTRPSRMDAQLKALVEADQKARQGDEAETPEAMEAGARADHRRRLQVQRLVAQAQVLSSEGFAHAALVQQHGSWFGDYVLAHELALCAAVLDPRKGSFLLAVTYDRLLQSAGFRQRVGTQYRGTGQLDPVDAEGFSDAMRRALGRAPLAEIPKTLF